MQSVRDHLRTVKRTMLSLMGKDFFVSLDMITAHERFGSSYGGWDVIPALLGPRSIVYSFGIGEDASFDIGLIERFGLDLHAFDPTPRSIEWVSRQGFPPAFRMHGYGIADFDGEVTFHPPVNADHVSHTMLERPETSARAIVVPVLRLPTIMAQLGHSDIDLLKMDIEGAEYGVLEDISRSGIRPRQLLVEFHHRFENVGIEKSRAAIEQIRSWGYGLFSVSRTGEEFSFCLRPDS